MTTGKPPRWLGLDLGERRIGIAISDPNGVTAAGLETIPRKDMQTDIDTIADIARRHHVVEIILGLPGSTEDSDGEHAQKIMGFGRKLARATGLPIIYEDERMSTISAIRTFTVPGVKRAQNHRDVAEMQAAAITLQKHLDRKEPPPSA
jgi:putative holliday junction resolvase